MFLLAFVFVIFYQIYKRKQKGSGIDDEEDSSLVNTFKKTGKKLTPKA